MNTPLLSTLDAFRVWASGPEFPHVEARQRLRAELARFCEDRHTRIRDARPEPIAGQKIRPGFPELVQAARAAAVHDTRGLAMHRAIEIRGVLARCKMPDVHRQGIEAIACAFEAIALLCNVGPDAPVYP